jgi:hypothetical protein
MTTDEMSEAWGLPDNAPTLGISSETLLKQVGRSHRDFLVALLRRDVLELVAGFAVIAFFCWFGWATWDPLRLWTAFAASGCVMIPMAHFFWEVRHLCKKVHVFHHTVTTTLEQAIREINRQIVLLKNVLWWYLLPIGAGLTILLGQIGLFFVRAQIPGDVWIKFLAYVVFGIVFFYGVYRLNQRAVEKELQPRKAELEEMRAELRAFMETEAG